MYIYWKTTKKKIQAQSTDVLLRHLIFCALVRDERDKDHKGAREEQVHIIKELAKRYNWYTTVEGKIDDIIDF